MPVISLEPASCILHPPYPHSLPTQKLALPQSQPWPLLSLSTCPLHILFSKAFRVRECVCMRITSDRTLRSRFRLQLLAEWLRTVPEHCLRRKVPECRWATPPCCRRTLHIAAYLCATCDVCFGLTGRMRAEIMRKLGSAIGSAWWRAIALELADSELKQERARLRLHDFTVELLEFTGRHDDLQAAW